ncbi:restriction endonuclease [Vaginella massiliensis]|uniref:restriction endonuclease n=1 Tax=Vaginella massiliensis TaxID=1816680 RepID=UPI00083834BF|nr:ATP cone domain-containing protein [Vaginella massiliensis]
MQVRKNSGELVPFDIKSLKKSLTRSGANSIEVEQVLDGINKELYNGMTTKELYQKAFEGLKKFRSSYAARYSLKRAVKDLGPEGYFFEKWIAKLFKEQGFETTTGITVQGTAVTHEIDVVACNGKDLIFCECKFRNDIDAKISVTTPMYILSRLKDVMDNPYEFFGLRMKPTKGFLVTNAYLTADSIAFSEHYGIDLISWNYPEEHSIKFLVDRSALYPLTCLTVLTPEQEKHIMEKGIILVKELVAQPEVLQSLDLDQKTRTQVLKEAEDLLDVSCLTC